MPFTSFWLVNAKPMENNELCTVLDLIFTCKTFNFNICFINYGAQEIKQHIYQLSYVSIYVHCKVYYICTHKQG